ncbi:Hok/Gef family protein [Enterobacter cloacae]|uniref:Hok/Gef family protein n=1 Tax=Enterobacter cloacae TaxID=550 RepID=UPI003C6D8CC4
MTWIRFSYGDSLKWRRVLETDCLRHGTESGKPRLIKNQGGGSKRHVTTVEFATSPALKQGGIHETPIPNYPGFDDYCFDNNHLTLVTRKTLCEIRFRNGSLEVTARMECRSGQ